MSPTPTTSAHTAAQAEVARLLDARGAGGLGDLVLSTPVAGRGPVDGGGTDDRGLLRVCVSVLGRVCELDTTPPPRPARRGWFARREPVVVPVGPLDATALALWRDRVDRGAGVRWHRLWQGFVARDALPRALDPLAVTGDLADAPWTTAPPRPVDPVATDLLRRLNQVLATRPAPVRRRPHEGVLAGRFDRPVAGPFGVPASALDWAVAQGEALAARLAAAGPSLTGEPALVVPSSDDRPRRVPAAAALERALDVLAGLDGAEEEGQSWRGR